ncbi:baseplate tail tube cap [Cyanophage P-TIM40]|uniref:Baseplate tail tube cap n=1 Tax=Cyanophage P-TIM40 TaxID=1589733 RepID=A0A0C5AAQ4_9CAUD|nr:baseplate tail tube cap [Cyanophage P-TIM40]AJK27441.1 baseplate tail tube cap [Cyanophage P-TIM40]|tara:strand:- start:2519 stop:3535 length:1017 start_codon:yes stop_codon:yes gene_type:complete
MANRLLVFPRSKPYGASRSESRGDVSHHDAYPTQVIDYLKLDIFDSQEGNPYNNIGGDSTATVSHSIYLYLPPKLSEQFSANYTNHKLGQVGSQMVGIGAEGFQDEGFKDKIQTAAEGAKAQLGFKMGADAINKLVGMTGGSSSLTANSISALTQKRVFNPYEETTFEGMNYRRHNFNFKLVPKSAKDVEMIGEIIKTLRIAMLPGSSKKKWLTIPDYFKIGIVRYSDDGTTERISTPGDKGGVLQDLYRFPTKLVLTDMGIDYSPDGNYASLKSFFGETDNYSDYDYGPVSYNLALTFSETALPIKNFYDSEYQYNEEGEWNWDDWSGNDDETATES